MQLLTIFLNKLKNYRRSLSCNMSSTEAYFRFLLALILYTIAIVYSLWYLAFLAIIISFTAFSKSCFLYNIFSVNKEKNLENIYLKLLPKYNPEPVFILNKKLNTLFKNEHAKKHLDLENFSFLLEEKDLKDLKSLENENQLIIKQYKCEKGQTYKIVFKILSNSNYILVYTTNITKMIEAEEEIINIQKDIVYAMGAIGESRSKETGNHVKRVAIYSEILALKYGLSKKEAELLKLASPMHDIGKVAIKDEILNKPGKLTFEEFEIMKTHASLGFDMLKNSNKEILKAAAIVANEHHEKWDGSGYPRALKKEEIHIYGRITAVADVFDALGSARVYKKAWDLEDIFKLFKEQRAKHFDPKLIDIFFEHYDEFDKVRLKYKDI